MRFQVNAVPGAPGDPITRYEWDFDGDGEPEHAGPQLSVVNHQFHDAGRYNGIITVRDGDSLFDQPQVTNVREITMLELIQFIGLRIEEEMDRAVVEDNVRAALPLADAEPYIPLAEWGENNGYTGNTLIALAPIARALNSAQRNGINFGLELWALSRQLQRLMRTQRQALVDGGLAQGDVSLQRADGYIEDFNTIYEEPNFKDDVAEQAGGQLALNLLTLSTEAYYWLQDAGDPCYANGRFPVPQVFGDPAAISQEANPINAHVTAAMSGLRDGITNYRNAAGNVDTPGPGVQQATAAVTSMGPILEEISKSLIFPCPEGVDCVTDHEALTMELRSMELIGDLTAAAAQGVWVRNWQACLTHAIKFRIEISLLRVEFLCGANVAYIREARNVQSIGLDIFDDGDYPLALEYYAQDERRCMMIDIYNRCIVPEPAARVLNDADELVAPPVYDVPAECQEEEEEGGDDQEADEGDDNQACVDFEREGVSFRACRGQVNRAAAAQACVAAGYDGLVSITSAEEQALIEANLVNNNGYWIGLRRQGGGFSWDSGLPLDYTNWRPGEPENSECVRMLSSQEWDWNDTNCDQTILTCAQGCPDDWVDMPYGYVCERRP